MSTAFIIKPEMAGTMTMTQQLSSHNLIGKSCISHFYISGHLQRMLMLGMVVIFIEFPVIHQHFDLVLNASVLIAQAAMRVYMFHRRQFHAPVMSSFFRPHEPFKDITMDDVCLPFHPPRHSTDREFDFDTQLTSIVSIESNLSKSSYPTYSVGSYCLEPSQPSVIQLFSDSSTSSTSLDPPPICSHGFIHTRAILRGRGRA